MPTFDIIKESKPAKTFRVASVIGKFDLQSEKITEHFKGEIILKAEQVKQQSQNNYSQIVI